MQYPCWALIFVLCSCSGTFLFTEKDDNYPAYRRNVPAAPKGLEHHQLGIRNFPQTHSVETVNTGQLIRQQQEANDKRIAKESIEQFHQRTVRVQPTPSTHFKASRPVSNNPLGSHAVLPNVSAPWAAFPTHSLPVFPKSNPIPDVPRGPVPFMRNFDMNRTFPSQPPSMPVMNRNFTPPIIGNYTNIHQNGFNH